MAIGKAGKLPIGEEANWWNKKRKTPDKSLRNEKNTIYKYVLKYLSNNLISVEEQKQNEITFYDSTLQTPKVRKSKNYLKANDRQTWNKKSEKRKMYLHYNLWNT